MAYVFFTCVINYYYLHELHICIIFFKILKSKKNYIQRPVFGSTNEVQKISFTRNYNYKKNYFSMYQLHNIEYTPHIAHRPPFKTSDKKKRNDKQNRLWESLI